MNYISYALNGKFDGVDVSSDPRYQQLCTEAAWFVFENSNQQFSPNDKEAVRFIESHIGNRVVTVHLLNTAFKLYKEQNYRLLPQSHEEHAEVPSTPLDLDSLSDTEISEGMKSVRAYLGGR